MGSLIFDLAAFLNTLVSALIGVATGWTISHLYAKRSEKQLLTISRVFAQIAEDRGMVEWTRDDRGNITFGRVIRLTLTDSVEATDEGAANLEAQPATLSGTATTTHREPP